MLRPGNTDVVDMIKREACQEEEVMRQRSDWGWAEGPMLFRPDDELSLLYLQGIRVVQL